MSLSLLVVASASEETVTLNTSYTVQGSLLTCTFTLDTGDTKGVGALSFYVKTTGLTFKPWNTEANKPIVQYGDMLPPTFKPGKAGVTDGYYSFTNGNGKDSRGYFIAAGGDPREGDSQRLLKGSSVLIFKATYTIDSSDYTLAAEDFKACLDGEQAKLAETRYTCVAPPSVNETPTTGVTVSGTAVSWINTDNTEDNAVYLLYPATVEDATIKAQWKDGSSYSATYTGTKGAISKTTVNSREMNSQPFTFTGVAPGEYKLVIFKPGKYVPKIVPITVSTTAYDCGQLKLWLYGDVTYDGLVNVTDAAQIQQYKAGIKSKFTEGTEQDKADRMLAANVTEIKNGDSTINVTDAAQIKQYKAGISSVFDLMK